MLKNDGSEVAPGGRRERLAMAKAAAGDAGDAPERSIKRARNMSKLEVVLAMTTLSIQTIHIII